jgi:HEAT repeat protein
VGNARGDTITVHLAPIADLDFFASRIALGEVTSIDHEKRVIRVQADRRQPPQSIARRRADRAPPSADDATGEDHSLRHTSAKASAAAEDERLAAELCESLLDRDRGAMAALVGLGPAAEPAVANYVRHAERRVRRNALLVLKQIATEASLPALLPALADADLGNRDLAWQAICRLPGLAQRPQVIEAAAAALARHPEQAAKWLAAIGPAAEQAACSCLRQDDEEVRYHAARVLREIGTARSLPALERLTADDVELVALAAKAARDAIERRQTR